MLADIYSRGFLAISILQDTSTPPPPIIRNKAGIVIPYVLCPALRPSYFPKFQVKVSDYYEIVRTQKG